MGWLLLGLAAGVAIGINLSMEAEKANKNAALRKHNELLEKYNSLSCEYNNLLDGKIIYHDKLNDEGNEKEDGEKKEIRKIVDELDVVGQEVMLPPGWDGYDN